MLSCSVRLKLFIGTMAAVCLVAAVVITLLVRGGARIDEARAAQPPSPPTESSLPVSDSPDAEPIDVNPVPIPEPLADFARPSNGAAGATIPVPPHAEKLSLNQIISKESILESVLNVGNVDDVSLAVTSLGAICGVYESNADYHSWVVPRVTRVRRLLEEGRAHPEEVVPVLRDVLGQAIDGWRAAWSEHARRLREEGSYTSEDTDIYEQCKWRVRACTYLLAELDDYASLPLLARAYTLHKREMGPEGIPVGQMGPCAPGNLLPMMHKLISQYPEGRLSGEARGLRNRYMEAARDVMFDVPYAPIRVLKWSALYAEADPRLVVFDPEGRSIASEPTTTMTVYPAKFKDGEWISDVMGVTSDRAVSLYNGMVLFINAAYPNQALPPPNGDVTEDPSY